MLLAWVVFPLVLALAGAGWGLLGELLRLPFRNLFHLSFGDEV
jgi:hypothetical protein